MAGGTCTWAPSPCARSTATWSAGPCGTGWWHRTSRPTAGGSGRGSDASRRPRPCAPPAPGSPRSPRSPRRVGTRLRTQHPAPCLQGLSSPASPALAVVRCRAVIPDPWGTTRTHRGDPRSRAGMGDPPPDPPQSGLSLVVAPPHRETHTTLRLQASDSGHSCAAASLVPEAPRLPASRPPHAPLAGLTSQRGSVRRSFPRWKDVRLRRNTAASPSPGPERQHSRGGRRCPRSGRGSPGAQALPTRGPPAATGSSLCASPRAPHAAHGPASPRPGAPVAPYVCATPRSRYVLPLRALAPHPLHRVPRSTILIVLLISIKSHLSIFLSCLGFGLAPKRPEPCGLAPASENFRRCLSPRVS